MEVSPVPSPFPGTNGGDSDTFFDDFHRANGNLIGRNGWVVNELGDPSPVITSNLAQAPGDGIFDASQPNAFTGLAWNAAWYFEFDATFPAASIFNNFVQAWWGDINNNAIALYVDLSTSIGGGHNLQILIVDVDGSQQTLNTVAPSAGTSHAYALRRQGANLIASIDGVDVLTKTAAVAPPPTNDNLGLYFEVSGGVTPATMSSIETGL